jgi:hypothetical protein
MKTIIASLAFLTLPFAAHAAGPANPALRMTSPYVQAKAIAQQQGYMKPGSGQHLYLKVVQQTHGVGQKGSYQVTVKGVGGISGQQKNMLIGTGTIKFVETVEGRSLESGTINHIETAFPQ